VEVALQKFYIFIYGGERVVSRVVTVQVTPKSVQLMWCQEKYKISMLEIIMLANSLTD